MADNVGYTEGVGKTIAADDISGVLHQRVKISVGADGTANDWDGTITGGATAARQDTGNTSVASIDTKTPALGQALAASSVPVVLTAAQITTLTPPAAITGFATEATLASVIKAEDTAHSTGDKGAMALSVRRDANTSLVDADGDYAPLQVDATGSLKVAIISGAGSGGTAMVDDAAFTVGTTSFTPTGGTYKSVRDAVDDNDGGAFAMTQKRAMLSCIETPAGDSAMDDTNDCVKTSVTLALPAGTNNIGDVDVLTVPTDPFGANADAASATGSISAKLRFIAGTGIPVTNTVTVGTHAVTIASGGIASGALASGSVASGAIASGAIASGAVASGAFASGSIAAGAIAAGATSFVKLEDVASADADAGVPALAVRKATPGNTSGTDGDYEFLQMSAGRLWASAVIDTALPVGTNSIGKISDITTSVVPGTGATNLGKAEDAAHSTGDVGVMALAVRSDTAASTAGTTNDYQPIITDNIGQVWINSTPAAASLAKAEDVAAASGDVGIAAFAVRRDTPTVSSGTTGDYSEINISGQGGMWITPTPSIGGGWSVYSNTALSNTKQAAVTVAATFGGYMWYNPNSSVTYIQIWDVASASVTVGTTAPTYVLSLPATSAANLEISNGIKHATAITIAATTTPTGSTAPSSAVVGFFMYK